MNNSVYIIIATYNGMQWLQECLESCTGYSVIVVDNASTDGTVDYIKSNFPQVTLLSQNKNLGFGQANNLGMRHALDQGADYVFLLNQDAYLQKGCIERLIVTHKQHPTFGVLSPIHLNGVGNRLDRNFSHYVSYKSNPDFYSDFVLKKPLKEIYKVSFVNAAGWLLSRRILETVGGFDPIFFHYGEDDNYCHRARYHDFKIGVVPTAFIKHDREIRNIGVHNIDPFLKLERQLKRRYANINEDNLGTLLNVLRKRKRSLVKLFLSLEFSKMIVLRQEVFIMEKVIKDIAGSRKINKHVGRHYLE